MLSTILIKITVVLYVEHKMILKFIWIANTKKAEKVWGCSTALFQNLLQTCSIQKSVVA